jgi:hypothetical protein
MFAAHELPTVRNGRWKRHLFHAYEHVVTGAGRERSGVYASNWLFDLHAAPDEQTNVAGQHPDVVRELERLAVTFRDELKRTQRPAAIAEAR